VQQNTETEVLDVAHNSSSFLPLKWTLELIGSSSKTASDIAENMCNDGKMQGLGDEDDNS